jgi:SNF2 family DNA or RNA helicase
VIYDEVDKLKQATGVWSKSWQRVMPYIPYRIGMTGTPAGNGYKDLFGQYLVVDGGYRLGTSYEAYLKRFFFKVGYRYELRPGAAEEIKEAVADITLSMTQEEYLPWLEKPLINDVWIELPPRARAAYDQLEREMFMELDAGAEVEVFNQAALINKCLQAANGQPYLAPGTGEWAPLHDAKLDALEDIVEESNGQPILVAWPFIPDRVRILERFPQARVLGGAMTEAEEAQLQEDWDAGKIPMLLGHPASMGHGLNLQHGGHIGVWFGLTWSLGLYLQFMGRLARQGQTKAVVFHRILCLNTADEIQLEALELKDVEQTDLKQTINGYRERRG